jgi:hypothetical protein
LVLSVAYYESRYTPSTVTREIGGKVSCGVMTPIPTFDRRQCQSATQSLMAGYMAGAKHLKDWFAACHGNKTCALIGYAGGYRLLDLCKSSDAGERTDKERALCRVAEIRLQRAALIGTVRPLSQHVHELMQL